MEAITFDVSTGSYVLGQVLGGLWPGYYTSPLAGLRHQAGQAAPARLGEDWATVDVTHAGVCGSDMAAIFHKASPALTPFTSFPSVLGHEIVGRVVEVGPRLAGFAVGDRVVVEPFLTCATRGLAVACEACRAGHYCVCHQSDVGPLAPGMLMGACRDHGGGWGEQVVAHQSQLFKLPDGLSDLEGVLVEPLSIGVHAVLRQPPAPGSRVLVIGSGMMAYAAIAALRMLGLDCTITHMSHLAFQRDAGLALGADEAICLAAGDEPTARVVAITGARRLEPLLGRDVLAGGGFEQIYDCVGTRESLGDALTFARPRGTIVLVGAPGRIAALDWTFVWSRELTILGTLGYGVEDFRGQRPRTFDVTMALMLERKLDLAKLVTHQFPLARYKEAIAANADRAGSRSIKTVFTPGGRAS